MRRRASQPQRPLSLLLRLLHQPRGSLCLRHRCVAVSGLSRVNHQISIEAGGLTPISDFARMRFTNRRSSSRLYSHFEADAMHVSTSLSPPKYRRTSSWVTAVELSS